jgi:hypothetical protein
VVGGFGGGAGATSGGTGAVPVGRVRLDRLLLPAEHAKHDGQPVQCPGRRLLALVSKRISVSVGFGSSPADQGKTLMAMVALTACVPTALGFFIREPEHREAVPQPLCADLVAEAVRPIPEITH